MKKIFETLRKYRNKKFFKKSSQYKFFIENRGILSSYSSLSKFMNVENEYDLICSNIVIKSLINKEEIESLITEEYFKKGIVSEEEISNNIKEKLTKFPYVKFDDYNIYIPIFNRTTNTIFSENYHLLNETPYDNILKNINAFLIDPFETYGFDLFSSMFTELIKISEDSTTTAFFDYELNVVLIINKQGRLDNIIYIFDRYIFSMNRTHVIERLLPVIEAYYKNDKRNFIKLLYKYRFISRFEYLLMDKN